jgi:hypothetical protein
VTLTLLAVGSAVPMGTYTAVEGPPGQRRALHVNDALKRPAVPVLLTSTQEVVVERAVYRIKASGLGMSMAIPLR